MSKIAIIFLGLYGTALVAAWVLPQAGVWGFLFESNYHPPFHWWGGALSGLGERWSFAIGAVMLTTVLIGWGHYGHAPLFGHRQTTLLLLFTLNCFVVTCWAYSGQKSWEESVGIAKWALVYACIVKTHSERRWLWVILAIYLVSAIHLGWDVTFSPHKGRRIIGGPVTTASDENFISAHAVALLPLAALWVMCPRINRWWRLGCCAGGVLMMNIVAHAQSRGAFLALLATGAAMPVFSRGRVRAWACVGVVVGALVGLRLFHEAFWKRMSTIEVSTYDPRLESWKDAWRVSKAYPLGCGGEGFDKGLKSQGYTTMSLYLEVLVAWGWQGAALFLGFVGVTAWDALKLVRRLSCEAESDQALPREYYDILAVFLALVGALVAGVFLNRLRWELWWVLGAYVVCMKNICERERRLSFAAHQSQHNPACLGPAG